MSQSSLSSFSSSSPLSLPNATVTHTDTDTKNTKPILTLKLPQLPGPGRLLPLSLLCVVTQMLNQIEYSRFLVTSKSNKQLIDWPESHPYLIHLKTIHFKIKIKEIDFKHKFVQPNGVTDFQDAKLIQDQHIYIDTRLRPQKVIIDARVCRKKMSRLQTNGFFLFFILYFIFFFFLVFIFEIGCFLIW